VFSGSGLHTILIPSSIIVLGKMSFSGCNSLESVLFETGGRLSRTEESAFHDSGLKSIVILASVVVLGESSFSKCESLTSVRFESGFPSQEIDQSAFVGTPWDSRVQLSGKTPRYQPGTRLTAGDAGRASVAWGQPQYG
jgi:hypothetical protein